MNGLENIYSACCNRQEREIIAKCTANLTREFPTANDERKLSLLLDHTCSNASEGKAPTKVWAA